ncbi:unnamed protein product [Rotaria sordida]|uniref:WAP domain-containing protein n=1 Tax=Rotaria sordida TaxID=392033 RepID=A0A820DB48_9BILA|nr:unnamed protein product [Rotaria sordida]
MKKQFILILLFVIIIFYVQSTSLSKNSKDNSVSQKKCPYLPKCVSPCPYGYIFDKFNCNTCECNPCKLGQPLRKYSCKKGRYRYTCSRRKGICTVSTQGNLHCCPLKRSGSCPPSPHPSVVLCLPVDCKNDGDCSIGQKCCKPCLRCTNVTAS